MLGKLIGVSAGLWLAAASAEAADIETLANHDWSGPYIGMQAGYGWGEADADTEQGAAPQIVAASDPIDLDAGREGSISAEGVLAGFHAGYNLQWENLVLGVESDAELTDMDGGTDVVRGPDITIARQEKEFDWLASMRLRAGYAMDRVLVYATGGLAIGAVDMSFSLGDGSFNESDTETAFGWTVGGGLEYALTDEVSLRFDYRYTDLEDTSFDGLGQTFNARYTFDNEFHAVRGGVSWYF
jgi:outer membrane immunogenic protein